MHALADRGRHNVRDEEDVLNIVHNYPSTSTRHISSATGQLSQRAAWRTVSENKLCPFHVQPVQGL
jgi:predicted nucleotidyltransferase